MKLDNRRLRGAQSLVISVLLLLIPVALYLLGAQYTRGSIALYFEAAFHLYAASVLFATNRYSDRVALLAVIRWACESWATFGRQYRTRFFGALFLFAFLAVLFELVVGEKVSNFVSSTLL